jgi:hypothetical protein
VHPAPGYAGALLCNNAELATEFAGKVARSVLHSVAKADAGGKAELGSSSDESLRRLSAEVRAFRRAGEGEPRLTRLRAGRLLRWRRSSARAAAA